MKKEVKNKAASIRAKLMNIARAKDTTTGQSSCEKLLEFINSLTENVCVNS